MPIKSKKSAPLKRSPGRPSKEERQRGKKAVDFANEELARMTLSELAFGSAPTERQLARLIARELKSHKDIYAFSVSEDGSKRIGAFLCEVAKLVIEASAPRFNIFNRWPDEITAFQIAIANLRQAIPSNKSLRRRLQNLVADGDVDFFDRIERDLDRVSGNLSWLSPSETVTKGAGRPTVSDPARKLLQAVIPLAEEHFGGTLRRPNTLARAIAQTRVVSSVLGFDPKIVTKDFIDASIPRRSSLK